MNKTKKNEIIIKHYKIKNVTYPKLIVFLFILLVLLISLMFSSSINVLINGNDYILAKDEVVINQNGLFVHYIDVGHGDATFIELPDGKTMLIDCGTYSSKKLISYIKNTKCNGVIDFFVLTHNHNDHYGQLENLFNSFEIKNIYRPNVYATEIESVDSDLLYYGEDNSKAYKAVVKLINDKKVSGSNVIVTNDSILIENSEFNYFIDFLVSYDNAKDCNDFSPIILLSYNSYKYLFSGDATESVENYVVNNFNDLISECHVLKVGHHGSNTSSSDNYLNAVSANYAVISALEGSYKSVPSPEVISRLLESGIDSENIFRTDIDGTVISVETSSGECLLYSINSLKTRNNTVYIKWYYIVIIIFTLSVMIIFNKKIIVINLVK